MQSVASLPADASTVGEEHEQPFAERSSIVAAKHAGHFPTVHLALAPGGTWHLVTIYLCISFSYRYLLYDYVDSLPCTKALQSIQLHACRPSWLSFPALIPSSLLLGLHYVLPLRWWASTTNVRQSNQTLYGQCSEALEEASASWHQRSTWQPPSLAQQVQSNVIGCYVPTSCHGSRWCTET